MKKRKKTISFQKEGSNHQSKKEPTQRVTHNNIAKSERLNKKRSTLSLCLGYDTA